MVVPRRTLRQVLFRARLIRVEQRRQKLNPDQYIISLPSDSLPYSACFRDTCLCLNTTISPQPGIQKRYWSLNQRIKYPPGSELQRELEDSSQDVMTDKYRVMK